MKTNFIVGNFLRAHSSAYRYPRSTGAALNHHDSGPLETHFAKRSEQFRNRDRNYRVLIQAGFIFATLLVIGLTRIEFRMSREQIITAPAEQELVAFEEIAQTLQQTAPPPPPRPPIPVEVPNETIIESDPLDLDATLDINEPVALLPPPPPAPVPERKIEEKPVEHEVFVIVEEMPELIGGIAAVARVLTYPEMARRAEMEGMVMVKVVVTETGEPVDPVVLRSVSTILDEAAVEAVMKQRFKPGKQRGKPVRVQYVIPVRFQLDLADGSRN